MISRYCNCILLGVFGREEQWNLYIRSERELKFSKSPSNWNLQLNLLYCNHRASFIKIRYHLQMFKISNYFNLSSSSLNYVIVYLHLNSLKIYIIKPPKCFIISASYKFVTWPSVWFLMSTDDAMKLKFTDIYIASALLIVFAGTYCKKPSSGNSQVLLSSPHRHGLSCCKLSYSMCTIFISKLQDNNNQQRNTTISSCLRASLRNRTMFPFLCNSRLKQ